jgi:hypothetical protein
MSWQSIEVAEVSHLNIFELRNDVQRDLHGLSGAMNAAVFCLLDFLDNASSFLSFSFSIALFCQFLTRHFTFARLPVCWYFGDFSDAPRSIVHVKHVQSDTNRLVF